MTPSDPISFGKALSDTTRQQIMKMICYNWLSVNEIVERINVTQPTVSHHLAVLREAGLIDMEEKGKQTYYRLNQEHLAVCCGQIITKFSSEDEPETNCNSSCC